MDKDDNLYAGDTAVGRITKMVAPSNYGNYGARSPENSIVICGLTLRPVPACFTAVGAVADSPWPMMSGSGLSVPGSEFLNFLL